MYMYIEIKMYVYMYVSVVDSSPHLPDMYNTYHKYVQHVLFIPCLAT